MEKRAIIAPGVTHADTRHYDKQAATRSRSSQVAQLDRDFAKAASSRMKTALAPGS